jgi:tRNA A-37 threonylcarbamoyl transferase component Bud32
MNTLEQLRTGELAGSKRLNLSCGLKNFPPEIFDLADTLEILDLSGNALTTLPSDLPRLHKLRILFCSNNQFTQLPEVLGQCSRLSMVGFKANFIQHVPAAALPMSLRWLILTDNKINELPKELGRCIQLQKLMLAGNQLQALPDEMAACEHLELLRIAANRFTALPPWLFKLPRLAWLAYAGNPFCADRETNAPSPVSTIDWHDLQTQQQLGEGASGVIYQALWHSNTTQSVAVKLFKGDLTSDGLPHNEMTIYVSAGEHPNLIPVHGKIYDHPESKSGLVMSLISDEFSNLAGPPSLDSCTCDIYSEEDTFSLNTLLRIAVSIASVAQHLHARGIMHGDLYAHNILHDGSGNILLGDFGAASFISPSRDQNPHSLQRIEVRAFSCLLEELLQRHSAAEDSFSEEASILKKVGELQIHCAHPNPATRPLFEEILQILQRLQECHT